jgi:hypothetical protein
MPAAVPDVLIVCPECREAFAVGTFDAHLRRAHRIYLFRGMRRSREDTIAAQLAQLVCPNPSADAWRALSELAQDEHGPRAVAFLTETLSRALAGVNAELGSSITDPLGRLLAAGAPMPLVAGLATDDELAARELALRILAHQRGPFEPNLVQALRSLLLDRRLPVDAQVGALANAMRSIGDRPLTQELLEKLVSGVGKARGIERLERLEELAGPSPAIDALTARLEETLRMSCPRCGVELRRPQMVQHLWDAHRLALVGRRVRDPWAVVEEWLDSCKLHPDPALLERCRVVAARLDPEAGPAYLRRRLLAHGLADADTLRVLLDQARDEHSSLCPWCYCHVPVPREVPALNVSIRPGRLAARGYGVELGETGLRTLLDVFTPDRLLYHGHEPEQTWTPRGATLLLVGPLVLAALVVAVLLPHSSRQPLTAVTCLLGAALALYLLVRYLWQHQAPPARRLLDYAWAMLAPRLHKGRFRPGDSAFLAGLARLSLEQELTPDTDLVRDLVRRTEVAVLNGEGPPGHLAVLRRLLIECAVAERDDPVPLVAHQLARCFSGKLPLAFAQHLLHDWASDWWTPGNLARLRVLLCDQAFEAGFEVGNLLDAGQSIPALAAVLGTDQRHLTALRLVWSLRPARPWDRCGDVRTAFEVALDTAGEAVLARHPDVLLWQIEPAWEVVADGGLGRMGPAEILLDTHGVRAQEVLFTEAPHVSGVRPKLVGWEMMLGDRTFRSPNDLTPMALRLERWFRYAFNEFFPMLERVETWQSPDRATVLRSWGAVPCPECRRFVLPRVEQIGIALDEPAR